MKQSFKTVVEIYIIVLICVRLRVCLEGAINPLCEDHLHKWKPTLRLVFIISIFLKIHYMIKKTEWMCIPDHVDNVITRIASASLWQATATGVNRNQAPTLGQNLVAGWLNDTNIKSKIFKVNSSGIPIRSREQWEWHGEGTLGCNFMLVTLFLFLRRF